MIPPPGGGITGRRQTRARMTRRKSQGDDADEVPQELAKKPCGMVMVTFSVLGARVPNQASVRGVDDDDPGARQC